MFYKFKAMLQEKNKVDISVVIPIYNEEENIPTLFDRLYSTLSGMNRPFEIIMTNDGSKDNSINLLKDLYQKHPDVLRIIDFHGNFGQHMAIMAGFERVRGDIVITMDADLQNPPEEIPKLIQKYDEGHDYVGSYRANRQDNFFRTYISKIVNFGRDFITPVKMKDHGCMLRVYSRRIIDLIVSSRERFTFITVLAHQYALNPCEVEVQHEARHAGETKYDIYRLVRVAFDLMTSFSLVPLQIFTLLGILSSIFSFGLMGYLLFRRITIGAEAEGVFTLFAILFFLMSILITGVGLLGEYLGRLFQATSNRPRYLVKEIIETKPEESSNSH